MGRLITLGLFAGGTADGWSDRSTTPSPGSATAPWIGTPSTASATCTAFGKRDGDDTFADFSNYGGDIDITFHGLVWRGTVPEAGHGLWPAAFESNGGICLDGEGAVCFSKDDAS